MGDRDLQDEIIRALADGPYRAGAGWLAERIAQTDRVERFARFLARHFYYERLHHIFKYSRALAGVTGRRPTDVLRTEAFDALLPDTVLGSRASAAKVAALAIAHIKGGANLDSIPYLDDLLRYEEGFMVVESGPRADASAASAANGGDHPAMFVEGTLVLEFEHDLPPVLPRLLQGWTDLPHAERRPTKLLMARTIQGRVSVAVASAPTARLLELADGTRSIAELAAEMEAESETVSEALRGLKDLGAIRFSTGS